MAVMLSACGRDSGVKPTDQADVSKTQGSVNPTDGTDTISDATDEPTPSNGTDWTIKAEDVQAITGVAYDTANQPADFPNIKQWEFRQAAQSVSLLIATGATAVERMNNSKLNEHRVIAGFRGEAIWEPIQGRLTVLDGERCAEVVLSKSHGDEATRIEFAQALATLLLDGG